MGYTICAVELSVSVFHAPPAFPSSSYLLPCSRAWVEQLLRCSLVSRSQGSERRMEDGLSLYLFGPIFYNCWISISLSFPALPPPQFKQQDWGTRSLRRNPFGVGPDAFLLPFGSFLCIYMEHVVFTGVSQFSNTNAFIPLLVNYVYRSKDEEEAWQYSIILLCRNYHGSRFRTPSSSHPATYTQPLEGSQGSVYQNLQWANLNEHVSSQVEVI